jgi:DNA-directed RNA polymerase specialized sigma24 family protein
MTSDEALMLEFQGGSRAAFEELFARYRKPLYGFFGRRLNDPGRVEDLARKTLLAVIRGTSRYEPRALVSVEAAGNGTAQVLDTYHNGTVGFGA